MLPKDESKILPCKIWRESGLLRNTPSYMPLSSLLLRAAGGRSFEQHTLRRPVKAERLREVIVKIYHDANVREVMFQRLSDYRSSALCKSCRPCSNLLRFQ